MALDVKVNITTLQAPGSVGLGYPLILLENASSTKEYTECSSVEEVVTAGFADTTKMYKTANTIYMQDNAPSTVAVCATTGTAAQWLADSANTGKGWRQLIVITEGETATSVNDIMTAVESLEYKMYFADVDVENSTSYTVSDIKRTVLFYAKATENYPSPVAALVGASAGLEAGSFTYKNLILKGIEAQDLSDTQVNAIHAKGGITFIKKAGDNVTSEGRTAGGEYIDIVDSRDYIISNLIYQTQKLLNSSPKIPYDNRGIALLESICINVMRSSYNKGIIATSADGSPAYTVRYAPRNETSASDRAERKYIGGKFAFTLAGAIHEAEIHGEIII